MINEEWDELLKNEYQAIYFKQLLSDLKDEYQQQVILPEKSLIFNAFQTTPFHLIKVVILGQDPYQTPNFSHGLAFSVNKGIQTPRSLANIYKELNSDLGCLIPNNGYLLKWATQGVLLLNTILTVRAGQSQSHEKLGWEMFTDHVIQLINQKKDPIVFILWGNYARKKKGWITNPNHLILESAHPSPLSAARGFFGSKPFSKTNEFLVNHYLEPIDWQIENI